MLRKVCALLMVVAAAAGLSGCHQASPFTQSLPQTPYQRYAQLRGHDRDVDGALHGSMTPDQLRRLLAPLGQQ